MYAEFDGIEPELQVDVSSEPRKRRMERGTLQTKYCTEVYSIDHMTATNGVI